MFELTTLTLLFLQFLFAGACFYLIMCADPNSQGLLGKAHRFIYKLIPSLYKQNLIHSFDIIKPKSIKTIKNELHNKEMRLQRKESNKQPNIFFRFVDKIINYLCYTNHPIVQVFYVLVAVGGFIIYCRYGLFMHFPNSQVSSVHIYVGSILAFFCFYSYYLACKVSPGEIKKENVKQYIKKYEKYYEEVLFEKANTCTTCKIIKPARSKHCKTCNICVSKFDHHCIWIRQCVGEKNYKYFLLFIGSHAILTLYGGLIGILCLYGIVIDSNLLNAKFRVPGSDEVIDASLTIIVKKGIQQHLIKINSNPLICYNYLFYKETMFVFIIFLCVIMGITLTLFLFYHLSMVKDNITTNERIKRSDFINYIENEIKKLEKSKAEEDQTAENKQEIEQKLKKYQKDLQQLKKWFPSKGFKENIKEIMNL